MNAPGAIGLCLQLLLCVLSSSVSPGESVSSSLWGKKIQLTGRPCVWQLQTGVVVPSLTELSVCVLLRISYRTEWTAFVYKAPGQRHIQLGLQGAGTHLTAWLFGKRHRLERELKLRDWYSICLTWSSRARKLRVYINGTGEHEASVDPMSTQLTPNGTLTLGVSHYVNADGEVKAESGNNLLGEIGMFRMWDREWRAEELRAGSCADGDVLSWDGRQWKYSCPPEADVNLHCAWPLYKIKMWMFYSSNSENCSLSLEDVTRTWLESTFPRNISVLDIFVSSPSRACSGFNDPSALHLQQSQASRASPNATCVGCFSCEVYVNLDPAADVEAAQSNIASLLSLTFSQDSFNLTSDPSSISILPVELFPAVTEPPPTFSPHTTVSETVATQSLATGPANMSTTGEPLDIINETTVAADTFFRVNMSLSLTGSPSNPQDFMEQWVKEQLEVNKTMVVLNLIIQANVSRGMDQKSGPLIFHRQKIQYLCTFHVQEDNMNSVADVKNFILTALTSEHKNGSITIQGNEVMIRHIVPQNCLEDTTATIYGEYIWPETFPQVNQEMGCQKPRSERAYRLCELSIETDSTRWARPDMKNCEQLVTISGLDNITVTPGNAAEVVDIIQDLVDVQLNTSEELSVSDVDNVVDKLMEVVKISAVKPAVGADIVNVVSDILLSNTDITSVANCVLNLTEKMGNNMDFLNESMSVTAPLLALSMSNAAPGEFKGLTFGVSSISSTLDPEIFLSRRFVSGPIPDTEAAISLPSELNKYFHPGEGEKTRIQFNFYGTHKLFEDPLMTNATHSSLILNSYIVSANIDNVPINNLKDGVVVTLRHQTPKQPEQKVHCMFWDFQKNDGQGGWNDRGCETQTTSSNRTSCLCDHLTHFALLLRHFPFFFLNIFLCFSLELNPSKILITLSAALLGLNKDVSRTPISEVDSHILTVISYLGCGISAIFLGITLLTYLSFEKLRKDNPSKILINLSAALLGLNMVFLLNSWLASFSNHSLCIVTAATLHYFLLASFTWMGLEAVHMYHALVKVFNIYIPSYILKFCAAGWGIPLVIVGLVLLINKDAYGSAVLKDEVDQFCWLQNDLFFYVTVVAFILLILLCNMSMFVAVLVQIRQMRVNKPSVNNRSSLQDLRAVASLTVLLGQTWAMAFFSFGPGRVVLLYLFTIFSTFQGFLVFLFHCLMKENVRKQWRIHLCCGRFRLDEHSDWSRTLTLGNPHNKNSELVDTSEHRKDSGFSTASSPNHSHEA